MTLTFLWPSSFFHLFFFFLRYVLDIFTQLHLLYTMYTMYSGCGQINCVAIIWPCISLGHWTLSFFLILPHVFPVSLSWYLGFFWYLQYLLFSSGMSPGQAEYKFLDKVKWLDMYGVDLHSVLVCTCSNMKVQYDVSKFLLDIIIHTTNIL